MTPRAIERVRQILREHAVGGITQADVQRRARERAIRRTGKPDYTAEDLDAAEMELLVGRDPDLVDDDALPPMEAADLRDPTGHPGEMYDVSHPEDATILPERVVNAHAPAPSDSRSAHKSFSAPRSVQPPAAGAPRRPRATRRRARRRDGG